MYEFRLIGYPIKHSLSPWIHKTFLQGTGLEGNYTLHEIKEFEKEIIELKKEAIHGFNITVPYKEKIIPYLDEIDPAAKVIGAVNTVHVVDGKWIGYNTDGSGYVRALQDSYKQLNDLSGKQIVLLGAGGAAKGIYAAFAQENPEKITIANRTVEKAEAIIQMHGDREVDQAVSIHHVKPLLETADIIVQTSSVGMKPHAEEVIVPLPRLKRSAVVSDIVYQPIETAFLKQALEQGIAIHHGHTMLLYQAQYAFEIWTGKKPTVGKMTHELKEILEG